MLTGLKFLQHT